MRLILCCALLLPLSGFAQDIAPKQKPGRPPYILKTIPSNLIHPIQQSIDIQASIPIASRWGLELGVGAVVNSWSLAVFKDESYKGLKLKPAIKYYTKRSAMGDSYLSLAFKYKNIRNDRYVNVIRQGGQYAEWLPERRRLVSWGVALRAGSQQYLGDRKRWVIEPYFGFGIRRLLLSGNLPANAEFLDERNPFNGNRRPGIYTDPDILLGFSLGWVL